MKSFFFRVTGDRAISQVLGGQRNQGIRSIRLHLSVAGATTENFTVTVDSHSGLVYDVNLVTEDMNGVQDLIWTAPEDGVFQLAESDYIDIAYPNSDARTWGLEVEWCQL